MGYERQVSPVVNRLLFLALSCHPVSGASRCVVVASARPHSTPQVGRWTSRCVPAQQCLLRALFHKVALPPSHFVRRVLPPVAFRQLLPRAASTHDMTRLPSPRSLPCDARWLVLSAPAFLFLNEEREPLAG